MLALSLLAAPLEPASAAANPAAAAIRAIDQCLPRLDPELDVGRERIAARCPGVLDAIGASPLGANLPRDWREARNELSAGGLRALRRALAAAPPPPRRAAPDAEALARLAAEARAGLEPGGGAWARFSRWLRSLLEGGAAPRDDDGPLAAWLREISIPQRAWTAFGYAVLAALLGFAAWVVRAELRAAGLLGRARAGVAAGASRPAGAPRDGVPYDALAPAERPAWLLRRIAAQLQRLGRLQSASALTARELAQRARLESPRDRDGLRALASVAERIRYAAAPPAPVEFDPALAAARELLARLDAQVAEEAR